MTRCSKRYCLWDSCYTRLCIRSHYLPFRQWFMELSSLSWSHYPIYEFEAESDEERLEKGIACPTENESVHHSQFLLACMTASRYVRTFMHAVCTRWKLSMTLSISWGWLNNGKRNHGRFIITVTPNLKPILVSHFAAHWTRQATLNARYNLQYPPLTGACHVRTTIFSPHPQFLLDRIIGASITHNHILWGFVQSCPFISGKIDTRISLRCIVWLSIYWRDDKRAQPIKYVIQINKLQEQGHHIWDFSSNCFRLVYL